jgi:hypothetical protein
VFTAPQRRKVRAILAALVVPLALATAIAMVVLWPRGETPIGSIPVESEGSQKVRGVIASIGETDELWQTAVTMRIAGTDDGTVEVPVIVPYDVIQNGLQVGDAISATFIPGQIDSGSPYIFSDFVRTVPLALLIGMYALSVLIVARFKGLMAMVGMGISLGVLGGFILPAMMVGESPLIVMLVGSAAMMFASIYVAHGISIRTTTAVAGTFGGLLITLALASWAVDSMRLTGTTSDDALNLMSRLPGLSMSL